MMQSPILTLKRPSGTTFSSDVQMSVISVVFDPVHIEDAGEYVCTGKIEFSELGNVTSVVVETKQSLTLKCKSSSAYILMASLHGLSFCTVPTPQVNITHSDSLVAGSNATLVCTVSDYAVVGHDISVNITWSRSKTVLSNDHDRVVISELSNSQSTFTSRLSLSPLTAEDANITCSATAYLVVPNSFITESSMGSTFVRLSIEGTVLYDDNNYVLM